MSGRGPSADWRSRWIAARARGSGRRGVQPNAVGSPRPDPRLREGAAPRDRRPCRRPRARGSAATRWSTGARLPGWPADCAVGWRRSRRGKASRDSRRDGFLPRRGTAASSRDRRPPRRLAPKFRGRGRVVVDVVMTQMVVITPCLRNRRRYQIPPVDGKGFPTRGVSTGLVRCATAPPPHGAPQSLITPTVAAPRLITIPKCLRHRPR